MHVGDRAECMVVIHRIEGQERGVGRDSKQHEELEMKCLSMGDALAGAHL